MYNVKFKMFELNFKILHKYQENMVKNNNNDSTSCNPVSTP